MKAFLNVWIANTFSIPVLMIAVGSQKKWLAKSNTIGTEYSMFINV